MFYELECKALINLNKIAAIEYGTCLYIQFSGAICKFESSEDEFNKIKELLKGLNNYDV